eukprot:6871053-Heterocapsa_arctica.AAC.1
MHELLAAQAKSRGATIFVPAGSTSTLPTVSLMGGTSRNIGSVIPALVLGPTGARENTGPEPTPFVRVSDTMPGGGDATGAGPTITSFGSANRASASTAPVLSPFRSPPGFSTSPERPAPAPQWLPPQPCPQCVALSRKLSDLEMKFYASASDPNARIAESEAQASASNADMSQLR